MSENDTESEIGIPQMNVDNNSFYYSFAVLRCLRRLGLGVSYPLEALLHCKEESLAEPLSGEISEYRSRLQAIELLKNKKKTPTKSTKGPQTDDFFFFLQFRELLIFLLSGGTNYLGDWRDLYGSIEYDISKRRWIFSSEALNDDSDEYLWDESHFNSPRVAADTFLVQIHPRFRQFVGRELRGRLLAKASIEFEKGEIEFLPTDFFKCSMNKQINYAIDRSMDIGLLQNSLSFDKRAANVNPERIATVCLNLPATANLFVSYCNGIAVEANNEVQHSRDDEYDLLRLFRGRLRWKKSMLIHGYKLPEDEVFVRLVGQPSGRKTTRALRERYLISSAQENISDSNETLREKLSQIFSSTEEHYSAIRRRYFDGHAEDIEDSWLSLCEWKKELKDWDVTFEAIIPWTTTSISLFDSLRWFRLNCTPSNAATAASCGLSPCITPNAIEAAGLEVNEHNLLLWNPLVTERVHLDGMIGVTNDIVKAVSNGFPDAESFLATKGNGLSFSNIKRLSELGGGSVPTHLLHRFEELLEIGLPSVLAVHFSQMKHITDKQALEMFLVAQPSEVILKYSKAIRNHTIRMKWLSAPPHVDLDDGFAYALEGLTLTEYLNHHFKG